MFFKFGALAILTLCFLVGQSIQQECAVQSVVNVRVTGSHVLAWDVRVDEPCNIDEFLVYIFHRDQPTEYAFSTQRSYVDVSFLEVCEEWTFVVLPISGHTIGPQRRTVATLPLPTGANLTLSDLTVGHDPYLNHTYIHWNLAEKGLPNCSIEYRVTIEEAGSPVIEYFYLKRNTLDLYVLSPCTTYQFGVRAINIAEPTVEGPIETSLSYMPGRRQNTPVLLDTQTGPTWANLSFELESVVRNPCALRSFYVVANESIINLTVDLTDHDRAEPVNVTLTDLSPATAYRIYAYLQNIVGWSDGRIFNIFTESDSAPELESTETKIKK